MAELPSTTSNFPMQRCANPRVMPYLNSGSRLRFRSARFASKRRRASNRALHASMSSKGMDEGKSFGMTAELDIYRTANILVKEYGVEQAPLMAAKRADALLERGDIDGQRVWKAVLRVVQELIRTARKPGEQLN